MLRSFILLRPFLGFSQSLTIQMSEIKSPKKLIEVALPLDDINAAASREKSIRHGHPSTLHLWWARRPLAAARAVLFAQLVNDPGYQRDLQFGVNKKEAEIKREKLFDIIRDLVKWENTNNEQVLNRAREAIWESWRETCYLNRKHPQAAELFNPEKLPASHDPFAGGGAIPLEAQRLGLESYASDLNPVAVMINKAMIEIPPKFADQAPVGPLPVGEEPETQSVFSDRWLGARGLAEDVRRYGHLVRQKVYESIGHIYPEVKISSKIVKERPELKKYENENLPVIAWIWARTVKSPNPAFRHVDIPLVKSFVLSNKKGSEVYIQPEVVGDSYSFNVIKGKPPKDFKKGTIGRQGGICLLSGSPVPLKYIREEGMNQHLGQRLMAVVLEGKSERVYLSGDVASIFEDLVPSWTPDAKIEHVSGCTNAVVYGLSHFKDLFTQRQLVALSAFAEEINNVKGQILRDAEQAGLSGVNQGLFEGGEGALAYAEAIIVYLAKALGKTVDYNSSSCSWISGGQTMRNTFGRQALPIVWDYAEANPIGTSTGSFASSLNQVCRVLLRLPKSSNLGYVFQQDAAAQTISENKLVSTDPPYYDNIPYAVLSDYFYIWMRQVLRSIYPDLFATMIAPRAEELVAAPYRQKSEVDAEKFFLLGMTKAMSNLAKQAHPAFPVTIYYAFKQSETKEGNTTSTGWVTFLEAVIQAGFAIVGTWPMRTEMSNRMRSSDSNALASSIVLVCRKRSLNAETISRRDFQRQLREEMPEALHIMLGAEGGQSAIAPVDLAQAAIGPGMAVYSKYAQVLNQDGSRMSVHEALVLINRAITDFLNPDSGNFDADTQFCASWFEQYGWGEGLFGVADTLARAKGTSVAGVQSAGVVEAGGGRVRLLKWEEYLSDWNPTQDERTPIWEACHYMIRRLNTQGESASGELLAKMPEKGEPIRQLAYHLYTLCERKKWAEEARAYNQLITSWNAIVTASYDIGHKSEQHNLGF